MQSTLNLLLFV